MGGEDVIMTDKKPFKQEKVDVIMTEKKPSKRENLPWVEK